MLGVTVDAVRADDIIELIDAAILAGDRLLVGNHNLHSTYLVRRDAAMQRFYERADLVFVDGMPLVIADRFGRRVLDRSYRSTPLDWIDALLARASMRGWSVYLLGGRPEPNVAAAAAARFEEANPGARFTTHHGYFDDTTEAEVLAHLDEVRPDLLLVGMGMPRQEAWLVDRFDTLDVPVALAVGGLFDYFAGTAATPPRWMGRLGVEWLGRLIADPRRLGHRYVVEPVLLAADLVRERRR